MTTNVLVLGDGTGGLVAANLLAREAHRRDATLQIELSGDSPKHTYQPGMLFLPFRMPGYRTLGDLQRPNSEFVGQGIDYRCESVTAIDAAARTVSTEKGNYEYDWLIIALGSRTVLEAVDGLPERWGKRAHGFYTPDSALRLADALQNFKGGDLVIDIAEMPIKCPVAPLEYNYDIQPVPGKFPLPLVGLLSLLKETRLNHLGKLAFRPIYWNMLLPGRTIPFVGSRMSTSGKHMEVLDRAH
jgi:sulfide:quinone oxidoreductase